MRGSRAENAYKYIVLGVGAMLTIMSGMVVLGWVARTSMVYVLPDAPPMRFNPAALWLLTGIALISIARQQLRLPLILGAIIALFAAATASQDLLEINLGIDNLLIADWSNVGPLASGRMSINTSCGF